MGNTESEPRSLALLIPGLDGTGKLYYRQIDDLAKKYRVCAWSYRHGENSGLSDLTRDLGLATTGEAPGSILVIAESFGGLVALNYILQYPERVRCLILVNAFPYFRHRLRIRLARALASLLRLRFARTMKDLIVDRTLAREGILEKDRQRYREIIQDIHLPDYRRRLRLVQEVDLRARLSEIAVPVILLAAGSDKVVPSILDAHLMASRIPRAIVKEFPDAGHALLLTPGVSLAMIDGRESAAPGWEHG